MNFSQYSCQDIEEIIVRRYNARPKKVYRIASTSRLNEAVNNTTRVVYYVPNYKAIDQDAGASLNGFMTDIFFFGQIWFKWWFYLAPTLTTCRFSFNLNTVTEIDIGSDLYNQDNDYIFNYDSTATVAPNYPTASLMDFQTYPVNNYEQAFFGPNATVSIISTVGAQYLQGFAWFDGFQISFV